MGMASAPAVAEGFTGFYFGGTAHLSTSSFRGYEPPNMEYPNPNSAPSVVMTSLLAGADIDLHLGYNFDFSGFVVGVKAGLETGGGVSGFFTGRSLSGSIGSLNPFVEVLAGYQVFPNVLLFGTAGAGLGSWSGLYEAGSASASGPSLGGLSPKFSIGAQYKLSNQASIGAALEFGGSSSPYVPVRAMSSAEPAGSYSPFGSAKIALSLNFFPDF